MISAKNLQRSMKVVLLLVGAEVFTPALTRAAAPIKVQAGSTAPTRPRLVLKITVDQLRGDLPGPFVTNMSNGGFRYLMDQGL